MDRPAAPDPSVFRHRSFRLFFGARILATLGVQAEGVTIGWLVYTAARAQHLDVKNSAFLVGMVGLAQFVPLFLLTLIAGETADRYQRRRVMQLCLFANVLCDLALVALSLHPRPMLQAVFVVAFLFGASRAFLQPAAGAMAPMLVPRPELPKAIAWNSLGFQGASIIGPWVGGALCAASPAVAFGAAAVFYLLAILSLQLFDVDTTPVRQTGSRWALIKEGVV